MGTGCALAGSSASLAGAGLSGGLAQDPPAWSAVAIVAGCGAVGSQAGRLLGARLPGALLRQAFAVVLLGVATVMLWRQFAMTAN